MNEENIIFPSNCYYHNNKGGYVLDITKAQFNADNTGKEDCTEALIKAYDFTVREDLFSIEGSRNIICLPNGIYNVSNTIIYSGDTIFRSRSHEGIVRIRFLGQNVWMRYCNPEYSIPQFYIDISKVWVLGFKTEGQATSFEVANDGKLEILGGIVNAWGRLNKDYPQVPVLINNNSSVSAVFCTGGPIEIHNDVYFKILVEEVKQNDTLQLIWSDTYNRVSNHETVAFYYGIRE